MPDRPLPARSLPARLVPACTAAIVVGTLALFVLTFLPWLNLAGIALDISWNSYGSGEFQDGETPHAYGWVLALVCALTLAAAFTVLIPEAARLRRPMFVLAGVGNLAASVIPILAFAWPQVYLAEFIDSIGGTSELTEHLSNVAVAPVVGTALALLLLTGLLCLAVAAAPRPETASTPRRRERAERPDGAVL